MHTLLEKLQIRLRFDGSTDEAMLSAHLQMALDVINDKRQFTPTETQLVEPQYENIAVEMAVASYNKIGAEGQVMHGENGINRQYEGGMYPSSLLGLIVPRPRGFK